jgi:hypothetical protein
VDRCAAASIVCQDKPADLPAARLTLTAGHLAAYVGT